MYFMLVYSGLDFLSQKTVRRGSAQALSAQRLPCHINVVSRPAISCRSEKSVVFYNLCAKQKLYYCNSFVSSIIINYWWHMLPALWVELLNLLPLSSLKETDTSSSSD